MADNLDITPGSGATAATDDVSGVHFQKIKIADGASDSSAMIGGDATNGLDVDVTRIAAGDNNIGNVDIASAIPAGNNNIGDVDVASIAAGDNNIGNVDLASAIPAGTNLMGKVGIDQVTANANEVVVKSITAGDNNIGNVDVVTLPTVAHDATDSKDPLKIGAKATSAVSTATLVSAGDVTDLFAGTDGILLTKPYCPYGDILWERVSNTDGNSTALTTFGATVGARNYITTIIVHNAHATTNGYVDIRDGTSGTIYLTIPLPANGGAVVKLDPPFRQPTANTALAFDVSAAITTVYLTFGGFKSKA